MKFLINVIFALIWASFQGDFSRFQIILGLVLGFFCFAIAEKIGLGVGPSYTKQLVDIVRYAVFFIAELLRANIRVAIDVLRIKPRISPGILAIPLEILDPWQKILLANSITLTPGTLSIDFSKDEQTLFVHFMYLDKPPEKLIAEIKLGFEARIIELKEGQSK
ncbi:MAG: hypothetical protein COT74_11730 [Bdellovibrionales bacterium CG10_big_fil_rev_8_21_14_0_10_45_34]|nr:MAG: hypothetical protein COT74_11730 [Bdellovibrionales bacterium CG10_big_fil_rev_8_21_14_0_10_45_34]